MEEKTVIFIYEGANMKISTITQDTITVLLWDALSLHIAKEDWDFLCARRFFSDDPSMEDIEAEFVSGTGITKNKQELWPKADISFAAYVEDLRKILTLDINQMARMTLTNDEKYLPQDGMIENENTGM